ncbi:MAG: hypothetical protein A2W80_19435 [Candidatus Riflebacteria bacterium GWC2_50_8]|nr:MAG: hypothetical protein A2W80_19435 [Candidatus Riflebacteria bacterium GWC2_50_8]
MKKICFTLCFVFAFTGLTNFIFAKEKKNERGFSPQVVINKLLKARDELNDNLFSEEFLNFLSSQHSAEELKIVLDMIGLPLKNSEIRAIERVYEDWFPRLANNVLNTKCLLCRLKNRNDSIRYDLVFLNEEELESYISTLYPEKVKNQKPRKIYKTTWEDRFCGSPTDRLIFVGGSPRNDGGEKKNPKLAGCNSDIPTASIASSVKPTGKNIVMASSKFDARLIAQTVKEKMDKNQVLQALGQPKKVKSEDGLELWFYTYEFPDKSGQAKWMILMVTFKAGKAVKEGFWLPNK